MFSAIFRSLQKSKRLREISSRLAPPADWMNQVKQGTYDRTRLDKAKTDLFDLCQTEPDLCAVLRKHGADRDTLDHLYTKLIKIGAGQYARGHFVAASALAFGFTLDYSLTHKDDDSFDIVAYNLIEYFQHNKRGPVA